jgi:hypothetical protein
MRIRFSRAGECVVHRRVLPGQPDELPDVVCLAHRVEPGVAAVRPDQPGEDAHCCRLADAVGIFLTLSEWCPLRRRKPLPVGSDRRLPVRAPRGRLPAPPDRLGLLTWHRGVPSSLR